MHMSILDRITWQAFPFKRKLYLHAFILHAILYSMSKLQVSVIIHNCTN